jgi:hypothetical protein
MVKGLKSTRKKAMEFLNRAPAFQVNMDIETLTNSITGIAAQQNICSTKLGPNKPAQVFSGRWVDKNNKDLAFYPAKRWMDTPPAVDVSSSYYIL